MSAVLEILGRLLEEVRTEFGSREIALGTIAASFGVVLASIVIPRPHAAERAARVGWAGVRIAAVATGFAVLTAHVADSGWLTGADDPTLRWMAAHRSSTATAIASDITAMGSPVGVGVLTVTIAATIGWRRRSPAPVAFILGTVAVAAVSSTALKPVLARPRPPARFRLVTETDFAYPSGHVTGTAALVGVLLLMYSATHPRRVRAVSAIVVAVTLVAVVAATRLYLGVHRLTDVCAGVLLGSIVVLGAAAVLSGLGDGSRWNPLGSRHSSTADSPGSA